MAKIEIEFIKTEQTRNSDLSRITKIKTGTHGSQRPSVIGNRVICGSLNMKQVIDALDNGGCIIVSVWRLDVNNNHNPLSLRRVCPEASKKSAKFIFSNYRMSEDVPTYEDKDPRKIEYEKFLNSAPPQIAENMDDALSFVCQFLNLEIRPYQLIQFEDGEISFKRLSEIDPELTHALTNYITVFNPLLGDSYPLNQQAEQVLYNCMTKIIDDPERKQRILVGLSSDQ